MAMYAAHSYWLIAAWLLVASLPSNAVHRWSSASMQANSQLCSSSDDCTSQGLELAGQGKVKEGFPYFERAAQLNSSNVKALIGLGGAYKDLGNPALAEKYLLEAASLDPTNHLIFFNMGNVAASSGKYTDAGRHFVHLLRVRRHSPQALYALGFLSKMSGNAADACALFQRLFRIQGDFNQMPGYSSALQVMSSLRLPSGAACTADGTEPWQHPDWTSEFSQYHVLCDGSFHEANVIVIGEAADFDSVRATVGSLHTFFAPSNKDNPSISRTIGLDSRFPQSCLIDLQIHVVTNFLTQQQIEEVQVWENTRPWSTAHQSAVDLEGILAEFGNAHSSATPVILFRAGVEVRSPALLWNLLKLSERTGSAIGTEHAFDDDDEMGMRLACGAQGSNCVCKKTDILASWNAQMLGFNPAECGSTSLFISPGQMKDVVLHISKSKEDVLWSVESSVIRAFQRVRLHPYTGIANFNIISRAKAVVVVFSRSDLAAGDIKHARQIADWAAAAGRALFCTRLNGIKIPHVFKQGLRSCEWISFSNSKDSIDGIAVRAGQVVWPTSTLESCPLPKCHLRFTSGYVVDPKSEDFFNYHDIDSMQGQQMRKYNRSLVCMAVPVLSPPNILGPLELPFLSIFLKSFVNSVDCNDKQFVYRVYIAYDKDDAFYDIQGAQTRKAMSDIIKGCPAISFKSYKHPPTNGGIAFLWNSVMRRAYDDGCDYMYQSNDDVEFITPNWTRKFVDALQSNPARPNFGVVGAVDVANRQCLTQSMVHRTHQAIFGTHFPTVMKNWHLDDYISNVYGPEHTFLVEDVMIRNTNVFGTRYHECHEDKPLMEREKKRGMKITRKWLQKHSIEKQD